MSVLRLVLLLGAIVLVSGDVLTKTTTTVADLGCPANTTCPVTWTCPSAAPTSNLSPCATSQDGNEITITPNLAPSELTTIMKFKGFGFSISPSATITAIRFNWNRFRRSGGSFGCLNENLLKLELASGTQSPTDKASTNDWPTGATPAQTSSDLWGFSAGTLTPTEINDPEFGVIVQLHDCETNKAAQPFIDIASLTVTFTVPTTGTTGAVPTTGVRTTTGGVAGTTGPAIATTGAAGSGNGVNNITPPSAGPSSALIGGVVGGALALILLVIIVVAIILISKRRRAARAAPRKWGSQVAEATLVNTSNSVDLKEIGIHEERSARASLNQSTRSMDSDKQEIGIGNFGEVSKETWNGQTVAVKKLNVKKKAKLDQTAENILKALEHANLLKYWGIQNVNGAESLVFEFADSNSLDSFVAEYSNGLGDQDLIWIAYEIASGMAYLEKKSVVHGNLASRNIFVSIPEKALADMSKVPEFKVKISDYVLYGLLGPELFLEYSKSVVRWRAVETLASSKVTTQSDVWSFGVVMWELWSGGATPYSGLNNTEVKAEVIKGFRLQPPKNCPEDIATLMEQCWREDPAQRPTFEDIANKLKAAKTSSK